MSVLLRTLRAASGQVAASTCTLCGGSQVNATAAGLKDNSLATYGGMDWYGDGVDPDAGYVREDWTIDACPSDLVIDFVRVRLKAARIVYSPSFTYTIQPRINGTNRGTPATLGSTATFDFDFTTDPADSQPWTPAKINAQKFGWNGDAPMTDPNAAGEIRVFEMEIQIHGHTLGSIETVAATVIAAAVNTLITLGAIATVSCQAPGGGNQNGTTLGTSAIVGVEMEPPPDGANSAAPHVPAVVTLNTFVLRSANPANLGDQDVVTGATETKSVGSHGTWTFDDVKAVSLISSPDLGTIQYVLFKAVGRVHFSAVWEQFYGTVFRYSVGGTEATMPIDPATNYYLLFLAEGIEAYKLDLTAEASSTPSYVQPNGAPWTWAALSSIANLTPEFFYEAKSGGGVANAKHGEIFVEVYGVPAVDSAVRVFRDQAEIVVTPLGAPGLAVGSRLTRPIGGTKQRKVVIPQ
ncbi:MAG: hypothetical protein RI885_2259 [Actinomycetota bacterium]|jgi:hypothetical protein